MNPQHHANTPAQRIPYPVRAGAAILTVLCFVAGPTLAEAPYTIQIGAFKSPSAQYVAPAREVGDVYATERDNGAVALSVGRFGSADDAHTALQRINSVYPDAFVRRADPAARRQFAATSATADTTVEPTGADGLAGSPRTELPKPNIGRKSAPETDPLSALSDEERRHVVYLDGELHYKDGNRFVPLAQYRAEHR